MAAILLIDDDASVREAFLHAGQKLGHGVTTTENAADALRKFRERAFDLIVTDLLMPDMDGFETIREFRREDPQVRIIAISGGGRNPADLYLHMAEQLGAYSTLTKPFSLNELASAINHALLNRET